MDDERGKVGVSKELAEDPNYQAYRAMEAALKSDHMGKWVAFIDGQLVLIKDNEEDLFQALHSEYPGQGGFVHEIVEKERVIHMRSPRIVRG